MYYQSFLLERRSPDAIVFHGPYFESFILKLQEFPED